LRPERADLTQFSEIRRSWAVPAFQQPLERTTLRGFSKFMKARMETPTSSLTSLGKHIL
jgi:hypothetical protein